MTVDSELAVLRAKIERLTRDYNTALRVAEDATQKLAASQQKVEHLRALWIAAEKQLKAERP